MTLPALLGFIVVIGAMGVMAIAIWGAILWAVFRALVLDPFHRWLDRQALNDALQEDLDDWKVKPRVISPDILKRADIAARRRFGAPISAETIQAQQDAERFRHV